MTGKKVGFCRGLVRESCLELYLGASLARIFVHLKNAKQEVWTKVG
jgi:hypothetical protein